MSRLQQILDIAMANSEENMDDFLELMRPEAQDRESLGATFEQTLGYDPIKYYDLKDLNSKIDEILKDPEIPEAVINYLNDEREDAVEKAYDIFDEDRGVFLTSALEEVIEEATGVSLDLDIQDGNEDYDDLDDDEEDIEEEEEEEE